jgi:hypothetical protein
VRTVLVRPDGSIISEGDEPATAAPEPVAAAPVASQPVATAPTADVNNTPRIVATTPVETSTAAEPAETPDPSAGNAATPSVQDAETSSAAAQPVDAAQPATSEPSLLSGAEDAAASAYTDGGPLAGPITTVTPRKKPAAPVQVAAAQPVAAAPANQNSGPLNLGEQASAPAPAAPAAAPASPATATPAPSTSGDIPSGTYIVQVTSQRSEAAASEAYAGLQRRFPAILGNRNAVIVAATVEDRGVFYRARIPTTTRDDAINLCENLQAAGGDCFVRRQP